MVHELTLKFITEDTELTAMLQEKLRKLRITTMLENPNVTVTLNLKSKSKEEFDERDYFELEN